MSKTAVIAEKPSVGRDIAGVLGCGKKINGGLEGKNYVVTWAMGHLVELKAPEDYHPRYKEWKMEDLPMLPEKMETRVIPKTGKQFKAVKEILYRKDVDKVIIATDAGREGELVARWILKQTNCHKPCSRLWISSVTDKAIREGFQNLKDEKNYRNLYSAAAARAEADWVVGINATRALTCKYNAQLSCGRVQTPTLAMIAKREEEIKAFRPESYYGIQAEAEGITFTWRNTENKSSRSFNGEKMKELAGQLKAKDLLISKIDTKQKKSYAPLLYDLTELQRDANKRFGFSAKETLNIMQRLYENHKVLTYPRTDSRYLTADVVPTLSERLSACGVGPYKKMAASLSRKKFGEKLSFVNEKKVTDHHAIIPTEQFVDLTHMTSSERQIYDLVVRRFLAVLSPAAEYEETQIVAVIGKEEFTAKGIRYVQAGWREVYEDAPEGEKEQKLPKLKKGDTLSGCKISLKEGKTTPPSRFTEASLLTAMENPVKFMSQKDDKLIKTIGETGGLGTVATRADIIEKLFNSFLIEKKGNEIYTTGKAKQLLKLVPEELRMPELTAKWELRLSRIAEGKEKQQEFLQEARSYTKQIIGEIRSGTETFRHDNLTNKKCPNCGKRLLSVNGKNAKLLVCQDRECGYKETVSRTTNARCPVCHKKMEMIGKGEEKTFVCKCGYKERLSKFQERREKEGKGVSKRDVQAYMKKQQKEAKEPVNNAFADALKNLKLD